jgi:Cdc6-like AAA superfamily ATPase
MAEKDPQLPLLEQMAFSLQELVKLTRVMSYPTIKQILDTALDTEEKRLVYHFLDGTKSVASVQKLTGVNGRHISEWGQEWEKLGIVESSATSRVKGRRQKSFDLSMFGISVPEVAEDDTNDSSR